MDTGCFLCEVGNEVVCVIKMNISLEVVKASLMGHILYKELGAFP